MSAAGPRRAVRVGLAAVLAVAGVAHFTALEQFLLLLPEWVPGRRAIVWVTGVLEIALAIALLASRRRRGLVGWLTAAFLVAVLPANVYQAVAAVDVGPIDSDAARWLRLPFQPLLVAAALWGTGARRADLRRDGGG